ncbi:MAG: histone deacetylase [Nitrospirae bacterium]|nr:MAG: histone deacetylase [Nitrospirota bacterium]
MGRVGFVSHPAYLEHEMGPSHPESPERLRAIRKQLESSGMLARLTQLNPQPASRNWICTIHDPGYVERLERRVPQSGYVPVDPDTMLCPKTISAAYLAVGGALAAVDAVMTRAVDQAFCAVRPPGHHAERDRAMGFCFFNNVAIATRYVQRRYGIARVLIVDWDVHHGNGTQQAFYEDPTVLFFSIHQHPLYPGTGLASERGAGQGEGFTINVPMPAGEGDARYQEVFETILVAAADAFRPECVMISAGFDAHRADPLASMELTEDGYAMLTSIVREIAARHAEGRIVSCLEGGYHLQALAASVERHLRTLLDA